MKAPKLSYRCGLRWRDLPGGGDLMRHCDRCDKDVYNLSGMTRTEARRVLALGGSRPCIHFVQRNGEIVHGGDPLEQLARQRHGAVRLLAGALTVQLLLLGDVSASVDPFARAAASAISAYEEHTRKPEPPVVDEWMGF